ncbi:MAG: hypothetical protein B6241_09595 [Spirochaetaceae bacterium 4572_59]|nr:MAG: hypothetical protein B6241_09595 [Spirochaetaceae bacterium 4572_59]
MSRSELDGVLPDSPLFMVKYDGHACVVNSILLKMLPGEIRGMRGYDAESGEMQQEAFFAITDYVTGSISPLKLIKNMLDAYDTISSRGFGMIHTAESVGFPRNLDVDLVRWLSRGGRSGFQTRVFFQTMNTSKVLKRKLPRIGGCFATALAGCFGSMDAALLDCPREDHRHGVIHACLPTDEGMDLCARNGIQIPLQPFFLNWPQEPSSYLREILGEREAALNPLRTLHDRGILLAGGSIQ